jgi:hypothetical protein
MHESRRVFVNFYTRLSPELDDCRRRLEKALELKSSNLLARILSDVESRLLNELSGDQRKAYFRRELDPESIRTILNARRDAQQPRSDIWHRSGDARWRRKREASTT